MKVNSRLLTQRSCRQLKSCLAPSVSSFASILRPTSNIPRLAMSCCAGAYRKESCLKLRRTKLSNVQPKFCAILWMLFGDVPKSSSASAFTIVVNTKEKGDSTMKFNKERTSIRSPIEGLEQYEDAIRSGSLKKVMIYPSPEREVRGVWEKIRLDGFAWKERCLNGTIGSGCNANSPALFVDR